MHGGEVQPFQQMPSDGGLIRAVRIGCDLNAANDALGNIGNESFRVFVIPFAGEVTSDELFAGGDG